MSDRAQTCERSVQPRERRPWGLPLRSRIVIALVAALIITGKFYFRLELHVPGHTGFYWMALLMVGVALVDRPGAGTLIGVFSGLLAAVFVPGKEGILTAVKYIAPGIVVDVMTPLLGGRLDRPVPAILVGAFGNLSKLLTSYLIGLLAGIPSGFLALGLGFAATTHVVFGGIGGWIGAWVIRRMERAGIVAERRS